MTTEQTKRPETVEEFCAQQLRRRIERVAARLADLSVTVQRAGGEVELVGRPGRATYAGIAANIQHEVATALMNLGLEALTTDAADADIARTKGE